MALEVDAGRGATRHDDADQRDTDGLAEWQPEADRQERHDEDAAAQPEQRPEDARHDPAGEHQKADGHLRPRASRGASGNSQSA